jgi:hypothetical protein
VLLPHVPRQSEEVPETQAMTVAELIRELQRRPQGLQVRLSDASQGYIDVAGIETLYSGDHPELGVFVCIH